MSAPRRGPSRLPVAALVLGSVLLLVLADLGTSETIDPFLTPAPAALGSDAAPTGGHCMASG